MMPWVGHFIQSTVSQHRIARQDLQVIHLFAKTSYQATFKVTHQPKLIYAITPQDWQHHGITASHRKSIRQQHFVETFEFRKAQ